MLIYKGEKAFYNGQAFFTSKNLKNYYFFLKKILHYLYGRKFQIFSLNYRTFQMKLNKMFTYYKKKQNKLKKMKNKRKKNLNDFTLLNRKIIYNFSFSKKISNN